MEEDPGITRRNVRRRDPLPHHSRADDTRRRDFLRFGAAVLPPVFTFGLTGRYWIKSWLSVEASLEDKGFALALALLIPLAVGTRKAVDVASSSN